MIPILMVNICNGKMIPIETIPGIVGVWVKENDGRGECKYGILDIL
jgi:hypothetical protein